MKPTVGDAVAVGILADRLFGEPPLEPHPVAMFGRAMIGLEAKMWRDRRSTGAAYTLMGVGAATLIGAGAAGGYAGVGWRHPGAEAAGGPGWRPWMAAATATWVTVAVRGLAQAAGEVARPLAVGDLEGARHRLPALVGRDPLHLDEAEIVRAVVESLAENTVDAVVAPALWGAVGGAAGALGYRAANTLDSMVGHHSARYERFGWASARLDDVANWIPARCTALLVAAVRPARAGSVWRAVRQDAPGHPSPNAGVAEAAFAAALGLRLGGSNTYAERTEVRPPLGSGRPAVIADIARAVRLADHVALALTVVLVAVPSARRRRGARSRSQRTVS